MKTDKDYIMTEPLKTDYPWHMAPLWAKYAATDENGLRCWFECKPAIGEKLWTNTDGCCYSFGVSGNGANWQNSLQEIPPREAELNRLADTYENWIDVCQRKRPVDGGFVFLIPEWQERRRQRIEAGLIDSDATAGAKDEWPEDDQAVKQINVTTAVYGLMGFLTSMKKPITFSENHWATPGADLAAAFLEANGINEEVDFSNYTSPIWEAPDPLHNAENPEQTVSSDQAEWKDGLPPVGEHVEVWDDENDVWHDAGKVTSHPVMVKTEKSPKEGFLPTCKFRPIETPEQKAKIQRQCWVDMAIAKAEQAGADDDLSSAGAIYDWLIESGQLARKEDTDNE